MEPLFLTLEQVLRVHRESLQRHGGSPGIRDEGMLRSAVDQPLNDFFYCAADLFGIAAAYAYHIAQAQAFRDGNKRTTIVAALTFLEQNGVATRRSTARLYEAMAGIAERRLNKADLAAVLREVFSR